MDFLELAKRRHSVRKYEDRAVEAEKLATILEAGRIAPTAANKQPCVFLVLNDKEAMEKVSKACSPHGAPLAIVVCADKDAVWVRGFDNATTLEIDSSIATDHMMLCAQDLGLSSCWINYFNPAVIRKEFNIPNNIVPVNILIIGYGAGKPLSPERHTETRKPLDAIVKYSSF